VRHSSRWQTSPSAAARNWRIRRSSWPLCVSIDTALALPPPPALAALVAPVVFDPPFPDLLELLHAAASTAAVTSTPVSRAPAFMRS
jgi:hypothetical protein